MATQPSNEDLDAKIERRHRSVMGAVSKLRADFMSQLQPVLEYVNRQQTIEAYQKEHPLPEPMRENGKFNKGRIIELLVQALVSALAIIGVLVGTGTING